MQQYNTKSIICQPKNCDKYQNGIHTGASKDQKINNVLNVTYIESLTGWIVKLLS